MTQVPESEAQQEGILWTLRLDDASHARPVLLAPDMAVTFRRAGSESVSELAQAMGYADPAEVLHRFARGCSCYTGSIENEIVTYGWATFDTERIGELGMSIRMLPGEAYIWDCATFPAYRGRRLYPALLAYMHDDFAAAGLRRLWLGTNRENVASQKGAERAGFHAVIEVGVQFAPTGKRVSVRQCPGISEQDGRDARQALLGEAE